MKENIKKLRLYALAAALGYYIIPFAIPRLMRVPGGEFVLVLFALPLFTFILSIVYGVRKGFNLLLPLSIGIIFTSTLFIYYNYTAWIYVVIYMIISLAGCGAGRIFYKK